MVRILPPILALLILALLLAAAPMGARAQPARCPPGLARKSPACVPPGQAKKWWIGDRYDGSGYLVRDHDRYRLPPLGRNEAWYRVGDMFIRVDRETRDSQRLIESTARVLD